MILLVLFKVLLSSLNKLIRGIEYFGFIKGLMTNKLS